MNVRMIFAAAAAIACSMSAPAQSTANDAVPVYDATQLALDRYTVIRRLWVDGWKSAFWITGYRDEANARRALLNEAAKLGAEAVINLQCLSRTDALFRPTGYYCYGNAIKLRAARDAIK